MYTIKYNYDTGDSFNSYPNQEGELEISWSTIEKAKENLKRLEEHYKQYQEINTYYNRQKDAQQILKDNSDKDWFVKEEKLAVFYEQGDKQTYNCIDKSNLHFYENKEEFTVGNIFDDFQATHNIILYTDNNKPFQFMCPYCGYFERLNSLEVVTVNNVNSDTKVYF